MTVTAFPIRKINPPPKFSDEAARIPIAIARDIALCYCEESNFGGIYYLLLDEWMITGPHESMVSYLEKLCDQLPFARKKLEAIINAK